MASIQTYKCSASRATKNIKVTLVLNTKRFSMVAILYRELMLVKNALKSKESIINSSENLTEVVQ